MKNSTKFSLILVLHLIAVRVHSLFVPCQVLVIELYHTDDSSIFSSQYLRDFLNLLDSNFDCLRILKCIYVNGILTEGKVWEIVLL